MTHRSEPIGAPRLSLLPPRLQSKIVTCRYSSCWLWTGSLNQKGYGNVRVGSRKDGSRRCAKAHRIVYEILIGPITPGLTLDHLCRIRHCVNPDHVDPVSHRVNILRGNGYTARNARKTHCSKGHPFFGDNLYSDSNGFRHCRTCWREKHQRQAYLRKNTLMVALSV